MFSHRIYESDVRAGDHLYRWRNLKLFEGIATPSQEDASEMSVVMSNGLNGFHLVKLKQFKGRGALRRVLYDQHDSYLQRMKLPGTSFIEKRRSMEEIVQNALLLLNIPEQNQTFVKEFLAHGFGKLCCTISHEQWRHILLGNNSEDPRVIELKEKIRDLEDKHACPICLDRLCNMAFSCGHLACLECAQPMTACHTCRRIIDQKITLFFAF